MKPIVYTFGCPRSGTTFLTEWLKQGKGYNVIKIPEYDPHHPLQSKEALAIMAQVLDEPILFVRIFRSDQGIIDSFKAAKKIIREGLKEEIKSPMPKMDGIAKNSIERAQWMIETEKQNTLAQAEYISLVQVNYDLLGNANYRDNVLIEIFSNLVMMSAWKYARANYTQLQKWFSDNWMVKPVRGGRLSYGLKAIEHADTEE